MSVESEARIELDMAVRCLLRLWSGDYRVSASSMRRLEQAIMAWDAAKLAKPTVNELAMASYYIEQAIAMLRKGENAS